MRVLDVDQGVKTFLLDLRHTGDSVWLMRDYVPAMPDTMRWTRAAYVYRRWMADPVDLETGKTKRSRGAAHSDPVPEGSPAVGSEVWPLVIRRGGGVTADAVALKWGYRYPNFNTLAVLGDTVVGVQAELSPENFEPITRLLPAWPQQTHLWFTKRGGAVCEPRVPFMPNDSGMGRLARDHVADLRLVCNVAANFPIDTIPGPFSPLSLLAPTNDNVVYALRYECRSTRAMVTKTVFGGSKWIESDFVELAIPGVHHSRAAFVDAKTSPDGSKLYVSWELDRSSGSKKGCFTIHNTADLSAPATRFDIAAGYMAPSPDGLTLAVLNGVGGNYAGSTLTLIDID